MNTVLNTTSTVEAIPEAIPIIYHKLSDIDKYYIDRVTRRKDYTIASKYIDRFHSYWYLWCRWIGGYDSNITPDFSLERESDIAICRVAYILANHFQKAPICRALLPMLISSFAHNNWTLVTRKIPHTKKLGYLIAAPDTTLWVADNYTWSAEYKMPSVWLNFKKSIEDPTKLEECITEVYDGLGILVPISWFRDMADSPIKEEDVTSELKS